MLVDSRGKEAGLAGRIAEISRHFRRIVLEAHPAVLIHLARELVEFLTARCRVIRIDGRLRDSGKDPQSYCSRLECFSSR